MTSSARPRLAIVVSHPTQYYSPWYRWMAQHAAIDLRVFYLWDFGVTERRDPQFQKSFTWDIDLLSGYEHEFVPNVAKDPGTHAFGGLRNPELTRRLARWNPSALLLFGYKSPSQLTALFWARRRGIPVLFRGDSHFLGRGIPPLWQRLLLRAIYSRVSLFLAVGEANKDYFRALGVPDARLVLAPHSVDATLFDPAAPAARAQADALRSQLGIPKSDLVVLFAGKLVPAKQPRELLEAFLSLDAPGTSLVYVGEGSEKTALEAAVRNSRRQNVHFLPFANQTEMPSRYLMADLFVLPSRGHYETWGLAVNEAMHLGVPTLVSDLVGCQRDLVTDGETGWVFLADRPETLAAKLTVAVSVLAQPAEKAALAERVAARIERYTYRTTTDGLLRALALATNSLSPS